MHISPQVVQAFSGSQDPNDCQGVVTHNTNAADLQWFREAKFGLFITWGPVSLVGTEMSWSRADRKGDWDWAQPGNIPVAVYDKLYLGFDPCRFNAREWMALAQAAGVKYIVFITKHHDGFNMYDSRFSDYKITNTPFGRDITAEIAQACHDAGLKLGIYYSVPDFYNPDFLTENHPRFIQYTHEQLRELCTNYGRVDMLWFDGGTGGPKRYDSCGIFRMLRQLQPGILINNRGALEGDYYTPEQEVGSFDSYLWESCVTIGTQWAWKPADTVKSAKECIRMLVSCAGGDGNLLLNVGPMSSGLIEPRQAAVLKEMGAWLHKYGPSIYATRGGPFKPSPWAVSTCKANTVYVHILGWKAGQPIKLSPLEKKIVSASVLTGGTADFRQSDKEIEITVPPAHRQDIDTIVALELDGPVANLRPRVAYPSGSLAFGNKITASSIRDKNEFYAAAKAIDDDFSTYWSGDAVKDQPQWLEVDLGKPQTIGAALLSRASGGYSSIDEFELQYQEADQWRTFAQGKKLDFCWEHTFTPITAQHVRLLIIKAQGAPVIREFQLFAPAH